MTRDRIPTPWRVTARRAAPPRRQSVSSAGARLGRVVVCGWLAAAAAHAGNLPAFGPIVQVSTADQQCQYAPLVAPIPGGGFAAAWSAGFPSSALLRIGDARGTLAAPPSRTAGRTLAALGTDAAGNLSVLWRSQAQAFSLQRFSSSGQALTAEVPLPIPPLSGRLAAAVASDGRFAAVWPAGNRIVGRWFSSAGSPLTAEFEIEPAAGLPAAEQLVAATLDASGHLAVAWSAVPAPLIQGVRFRRFDTEGRGLGSAVDLAADALGPGIDHSPSIAATGDGGLTVAWERNGEVPFASFIRYRSFDASDRPLNSGGTIGAINDRLPVLAGNGTGRVALAWQHNDGKVWMAMLSASTDAGPPVAMPLDPTFDTDAFVETAALAFLSDGRLAALWDVAAPPGVQVLGCNALGIFGRIVDPDPDFKPPTAAPEQSLSGLTGEAGLSPQLTSTADGGFVAVWQTGNPGLVASRAFDAGGVPRAAETVLDPTSTGLLDIATTTLADGSSAVAAWAPFNGPSLNVSFRLIDAAGQPTGLKHNVGPPGARMPMVAARREGFLLAWSSALTLTVEPFHADGSPAGPPVAIGQIAAGSFTGIAAVPGGFVVSWNTVATDLLAQHLDDLGRPDGAVFHVWSDPNEPQVLPQVAAIPGNGVAIAWSAFNAPFQFASAVRVRRFGLDGQPWEDPVDVETLRPLAVGDEKQSLYAHAMRANSDGTLWLLLGRDSASRVTHLAVTAVRDGQPLGPAVAVGSSATNGGAGGLYRFGHLTAGACGWVAGWSAALPGGSYGSFFQRATGGCLSGPPTLRLGAAGRFRAQIQWHTPANGAGAGNPRRLADDSGSFWFFAPTNPELMLKVLDGRKVDGAFWVLYATLTDVAFDLTITDTETVRSKTYSKAQGGLESRADVRAFPASGAGSEPPMTIGGPRDEPQAASACPATAGGLCLAQRFDVAIRFTDPRDHTEHDAVAVPLSSDSGSFWFFGPNNLEMLAKIVDGRPVNQHWWFFYGALSNVDYDITVTDTETGAQRVYQNRHGALISTADIDAFP